MTGPVPSMRTDHGPVPRRGPLVQTELGGDDLAGVLRERVAAELTRRFPPGSPAQANERAAAAQRLLTEQLAAHAEAQLAAGLPVLDPDAEARIGAQVWHALFGTSGLQPLLDDPRIETIFAYGHDQVVVRYADGTRHRVGPVAASDAELEELVRAIAARAGVQERRFDRGRPRLSVKLPDGSRLTAVIAVSERPCVSIRRHRYQRITLAPTPDRRVPSLVELGMLDAELAAFLAGCVRGRRNLIVSGGMSAGKTTLLRALAAEIPAQEWLVTIEDALELGLDADPVAHPHVFAWQSREANIEGEGEVDQAELVRWAMRMSPDRVIVGEVRGIEALPMLNVMQQGCDGSMSTLHASSATGAFMKLGSYALQSPERIPLEGTALMAATAIHLVIQLGTATDGRRVITEVAEVTGVAGIEVLTARLYRPGHDGTAIPAGPPSPQLAAVLHAAGHQPALPPPAEDWRSR